MSSSSYFGEYYQIGLVVERIQPDQKDFMKDFFEQVYAKNHQMYQYVDPKGD